jgi:diguanylate cyclase (GGDEF)-like protein
LRQRHDAHAPSRAAPLVLAVLAGLPAAALASVQALLAGQALRLGLAFCVGLLAMLMVCGLIQYVVARDRLQFDFALLALGLALGAGGPFLDADAAAWKELLPLAGYGFAGLSAALLVRRYSDAGEWSPRIDRLLGVVPFAFGAAIAATPFLPLPAAAAPIAGVGLMLALLALAAGIGCRRRATAGATLFLVATAAMLAGFALLGARALGWPAHAAPAANPIGIAGAVALLCLAVALAQRQHVLSHESTRTQAEALATSEQLVQTLRASEALLTRTIAQRSQELESVSQRLREREQQALHDAHHDALTGLANPVLLTDRIARGIIRSKRHNCRIAVLVIDLDNFSAVNAAFGTEVGDEVLKSVATRLCGIVRAEDTVARLGSDEFVIVLEEVFDPLDPQRVAEAVATELAQPFQLAGQVVNTSASIGCAMFPDGGAEPADLLRHADKLMRRAKRGKEYARAAGTAVS